MNGKPIWGTLTLAITSLVTMFLFSSFNVQTRAQQTLAPNAESVEALWVVGTDGIVKLATADGTVLFEIPAVEDVRAAAIDDQRGVIWTFGQSTLHAYDFQGTLLRSAPVPEADDDAHLALTATSHDGSVWLGLHTTLFHFDAQGQLLSMIALSDNVQALAVDRTALRLWVATQKKVSAYDDAGTIVATIDLGKNPDVQDIDVDAQSGDLWVALNKTLRLYDASGSLLSETAVDKLQRLASDGQGGVWIATAKDLIRIDQLGQVTANLHPFAGQGEIVALVVNAADQSAWAATQKVLSHVSAAGVILQQLEFNGANPDVSFAGTIHDLALYADLIPPVLSFSAPSEGSFLNTNTPDIEVTYSDSGVGVDTTSLHMQAEEQDLAVDCAFAATNATCTPATTLPEGAVRLTATIADHAGNTSEQATVSFTIDTIPPKVILATPGDGTVTNQAQLTFVGYLSEPGQLTLNGQPVSLGPNHEFSHGPLTLTEGLNTFTLTATDLAGNESTGSVRVTLDTLPPAPVNAAQLTVSEVVNGEVTVTGTAGSVEPGAKVRVTNTRTNQTVTAIATAGGGFMAAILAQSGDVLALTVVDMAGNTSAQTTVVVGSRLPPDPAAVAAPIDPTVATTLFEATAFLYTGANPIQTGVAAGTIVPPRAAVLRGRVRTHDGQPLPGVTLSIHSHAEFGQTLSRADGMFDLAVNGGGLLTVKYDKANFLSARRQVNVPWEDYAMLPDVVLIPRDAQVTTIDLTSSSFQVARGSVVSDARGTRQATLLFAPGTQASMRLPSGPVQTLTTLHVRATEFSVGANGPQAMPGTLPQTTGYTHAANFSVDEAVAAGAVSVNFSQPVIFYLQNFLDLPVGGGVPLGGYDLQRDRWIPHPNGRIVKVLSINAGVASLDVNGSGQPASAADLTALGITNPELREVGRLYAPSQTLWRLLLPHFSDWDT